MKTITQKIEHRFLSNKYVPPDKRDIYLYGFRLIVSDIINFSLVLLLGTILNSTVNAIIFLLLLLFVRRYTGGFHAKTFTVCRLCMILSFPSVLLLSHYQQMLKHQFIWILVINIFCVAVISVFAPVEHSNKPLNEKLIRCNKKKAVLSSILVSVLSLVLHKFGHQEGVFISNTLLLIVILMFIGIIIRKGEKKNA